MLASSARTAHADYYIDAVGGNDANSGTTPSLAIKTIARLNQLLAATAGQVPSGETIHLFRGGRYEGQITVASNATGVTIQAYPLQGAGALPIVDGSTELAGWTHEGSGLWSAPWAGLAILMHLYVNDVAQTMARFPNTGWLRNAEYFTGTPPRVEPAIDTPLPSGNLVGSYLVFRTSNFTYDTSRVIGLNGQGELELRTSLVFSETQATTKRWGFFLRGNLDLLDVVGEWCHDRANSKVYLKTGDSVNPPYGVRVSNHPFGVRLPGGGSANSGIVIKAIDFRYQAEAGVVFAGNGLGAYQVTIEGCAFRDVYIGIDDRSIGVPSPGGMVIHGNTFTNCFNSALILEKDDSSITGNMLVDIGLLPGFGKTRYGGYIGLRVGASGYLLEGNVINRTGYGGIEANGSGTIRRNHISRASAILTDGGGIQFDVSDGLVIEENTVLDLGDPVNLESAAPDYHAYGQLNYGIYFGNRSIQNATVQSNVVANCVKGIYVDHSLCSENAQVIGNTLFGNRTQLSITDLSNEIAFCGGTGGYPPGTGGPNYLPAYDDTYAGNILYGLSSSQSCVEQSTRWAANLGAMVDFGEFNGNYCFNPFTTVPNRIAVAYSRPEFADFYTPVTFGLSNADWVAQYDAAAGFSPLQLPDHAVSTVEQVMLTEPFNGGAVPDGWICLLPGTRSIESNAMRSIGSPWIEHLPGCGIDIPDIAPVLGRFRLSFSASSAAPTVLSAGYWFNDQNLYQNQRFVEVGTGPGNYEMVVELDRDAPGDYRWFNITDGKFGAGVNATSSVLLDNVLVERVTLDPAFTAQIAASHRLFYHCPLPGTEADSRNVLQYGGTLTIPGDPGQCWSDVFGNFYAAGEELPLDEWASIVLFRIDPTYDIDVASYDVQGSETWTTDKKVRGSIVIESGETLTIDGATIEFADSRQGDQVLTNIVVQPGGLLNLINGAHLTTLQGCGNKSMWDGIKVLGVNGSYEYTSGQGRVSMTSGATISNALTGILAGDADPMAPGYVGNAIGGGVRTQGAVFRNNLHDVVLHAPGLPIISGFGCSNGLCSRSGFQDTEFISDAPLNYQNEHELFPVAHLRVSRRPLVFVKGCTFANDRNDLLAVNSSLRMGHGIESFNSGVRVVPCLQHNCTTGTPNVFRNLDHGLHALGSAHKLARPLVRLAQFTDNICGVYNSGVSNLTVADCTFELGRWDVALEGEVDEAMSPYHRGIFTHSSYGFIIQDNVLGLSANANAAVGTEGIVIGYSQDHNDAVFRNTITGLERGIVGEGICADVSAAFLYTNSRGLQFLCNTVGGNEEKMSSRIVDSDEENSGLHTIRGYQGSLANLRPAGNDFGSDPLLDFKMNTSMPITYVWDDAGTNAEPDMSDALGLGAFADLMITPSDPDYCDTWMPNVLGEAPQALGELREELVAAAEAYAQVEHLYHQLIDGGDTEALIANVDSICAILQEEPNEINLEPNPYLSISVLTSIIYCESISDAQKAAILAANPEPTQMGNLVDLLWQIHFPEHLIALVEASWNVRTYRTEVEMQLAATNTRVAQLANAFMYMLQADSIMADAALVPWRQLTTPAARLAEAGLLLEQQRHEEALDMLDDYSMAHAAPADSLLWREVRGMMEYIDLLRLAHNEERSPYELDSLEVAQLLTLRDAGNNRTAVWVGNLLCAAYGHCTPPLTGGDGLAKLRRRVAIAAPPATTAQAQLRIAPNPASSAVQFTYALKDAPVDAWLTVTDAMGRVAHRVRIAQQEGSLSWGIPNLSAGVYTASLTEKGISLLSEKLIVHP